MQIELLGQGGHRLLGATTSRVADAASQMSGTTASAAPRRTIPIHDTGMVHRVGPPVGVESVRRLSAVSLGTSGSTTACRSTWSCLTSTNELVPQSIPSEKRKVGGSIPRLATRYAQVSDCLAGPGTARDRVHPPKSAAGRPSAW